MSRQTKMVSLIESLTNTGVGFLLSLMVWYAIRWSELYDIQTTVSEGIEITLIFTVVSIARGYALRRAFENFHSYLMRRIK